MDSLGDSVSPSPVPELIGDYFEWLLGDDPIPATRQSTYEPKLVDGEEEVYMAESDCSPNVMSDLIAEYITDTICRIDSDAMVDVRVMMKADLIIASGEVACCHPAKSAIIHSDQFLTTLNSSIREVVGDILSRNSFQPTIAAESISAALPEASPAPPVRTQSSVATPAPSTIPPLSPQASMTALGGFDDVDPSTEFDMTNCHLIIALTPGIYKAQRDWVGGRWGARSGSSRFAGQLVANKVEKFFNGLIAGTSTTAPGGISVQVLSHREAIHSVSVAVNVPKLGALVAQLVGSQEMMELRSIIGEGAVFSIRNVNRTRATGVSSCYFGKDWRHPARYGPVLAKLEANYLIQNDYCTACEVELQFAEYARSSTNNTGIVGARVVSFSTVLYDRTDDDLREIVWERCRKMTIDDIRTSLAKIMTSPDFFMMDNGGSSCATSRIELKDPKA